MPVEPDPEPRDNGDRELRRVRRRRKQEALDAGLGTVEAELFADSAADIGDLRRLRQLGCPARLMFEILRD